MIDDRPQSMKRIPMPLLLLLLAAFLGACGDSAVEAKEETTGLLAAREASLAERERQLAGREAAAGEREVELSARGEELEEQERQLADREAALERRRRRLADREAQVASGAAAVAATQERPEASQEDLAAQREAAARAEARQAATVAAAGAETERARAQPAGRTARQPPAVYVEATIRADTLIDVEFLGTVSSATSRVGDTFRSRLVDDLISDDGLLAVPAGAELIGTVVDAVPLRKVGGQARLELSFDELVLPSGETVPTRASFFDQGRDETRRDARTIGIAAVAGALLGRAIDDGGSGGTLLGAILGGAAGTAIAARRGEEIEILGGMRVTLRLDQPMVVVVPWKSRYQSPEVVASRGGG